MTIKLLLAFNLWLTAFLPFTLLASSPFRPSSEGQLHFISTTVNFGRVKQGKELHYRFHFQNIGKGLASIQKVHAACGCTLTNIDPYKIYQSGERGYVDVVFDTAGFVGPVDKVLTVETSEHLNPYRILLVRADVMADFLVDKPLVDLGRLTSGARSQDSVIFSPLDAFPLQLLAAQYKKDRLEVQLTALPDGQWQVQLQLKPVASLGSIMEKVSIRTNSQSQPSFDLWVKATVSGPINMVPDYVEFGVIEKQQFAKRLLLLEAQAPFRLVSSRLELYLNGSPLPMAEQYLQWGVLAAGEPQQSLELKLQNMLDSSGSIHGTLTFMTSNPLQAEIAVDFYAFFL